jgi:hypothetical protein
MAILKHKLEKVGREWFIHLPYSKSPLNLSFCKTLTTEEFDHAFRGVIENVNEVFETIQAVEIPSEELIEVIAEAAELLPIKPKKKGKKAE